MNLVEHVRDTKAGGIPRVSGGEPYITKYFFYVEKYSPRERG